MKAVQLGLTYFLTAIFVVMFVSNLVVAILGLKFGVAFIIINYVIPYGTLGIGMQLMKPLGRYFWVSAAEKEYGPNWQQVLFPDATDTNLLKENENKQSSV